jgi:hypothetical protein
MAAIRHELKAIWDDVDARLAKGNGTWPQHDYVRDETWAQWQAESWMMRRVFQVLDRHAPPSATAPTCGAASKGVRGVADGRVCELPRGHDDVHCAESGAMWSGGAPTLAVPALPLNPGAEKRCALCEKMKQGRAAFRSPCPDCGEER